MSSQNEKIAKISFATVYPLYLAKIVKKWRTQKELDAVIEWLTGYNKEQLLLKIDNNVSLETFFGKASLNPDSINIKGLICGYRVEEIENPLTRQVRYLDKLVDDLAKGKKIEKILNV